MVIATCLSRSITPIEGLILTLNLDQVSGGRSPLMALKGTPEFGDKYRQAQDSLLNLVEILDGLENDLVNEYKRSFTPVYK